MTAAARQYDMPWTIPDDVGPSSDCPITEGKPDGIKDGIKDGIEEGGPDGIIDGSTDSPTVRAEGA